MRLPIAVALAVAAGIAGFSVLAGLTGSTPAGAVGGLLVAAGIGWLQWTRSLVSVDETAATRGLKVLSGIAAVAALAQLAWLTPFMASSSNVAHSTIPGSRWEVRHSCLSSYFVAAEAVGRGGDAYDPALYTDPGDTGVGQRKARMIGPVLAIDVYEYPPPFLIVPRLFRVVTTDFERMRTLWFGLTVAFLLMATVVVARRLGGAAGTRALLLLPVLWAAPSTLSTLQKGNIQPVIIALAMVAMVLFEARRFLMGGALLAYAIVSKLYPAMLGLYLLVTRQWRAAAWSAAMGLIMVVLTFADLGVPPFVAFLHHLPGLLSGEAFPAFRNAGAQAINISIPGLTFKAGLFGAPGMGFGASKIVGWIFTLVVLWATVRAALRPPNERERPLVWLAVIILATLRSPFLPATYGVWPALWMLTLLAATYRPTAKTLALVVAGVVALSIHWPLDWPMDPRVRALLNFIPQGATIALTVLGLTRRVAPEGDTLTT